MLFRTSVASLVAIIAYVEANPHATVARRAYAHVEHTTVTGLEYIIPTDAPVAKGGAIDLYRSAMKDSSEAVGPSPTPAPSLADRAVAANGLFTISLVNNLGRPISTAHGLNDGAQPISLGNANPGVLDAGRADWIAVPPGWAGRIPIVEYGGSRRITYNDESLIEASFMDQNGQLKFDINVSYVDGFSLPITCSCDRGVAGGCNKYLWDLNRCPDDNGVGSCRNPNRHTNDWAVDFFRPCQHAAFTFPNDDANTGNGFCGGDTVVCCVGTNCPRNPRQS